MSAGFPFNYLINMKRVLITGILGFTGGYVASEFAAHGWKIWGLGSQAPDLQAIGDQVRYIQADLADLTALCAAVDQVKPQAVVHLAGIAFVAHGNVDAIYRVNLMGTRNLLTALAKLAIAPQCVLLASSANVYGNTSSGMLNEDSSLKPANDYAVSKLAMEYMAKLWVNRLPIVIARPFNYTGRGQSSDFLLPKIIDHFWKKSSKIELGNLDVWRDFSDVRAVAVAYRRLIECRPVGCTVNVCSGLTYSLREVVSMVSVLSGHSLEISVNPAFVRHNEVTTLGGNPARLRELIGPWESPHLTQTLVWMLAGLGDIPS